MNDIYTEAFEKELKVMKRKLGIDVASFIKEPNVQVDFKEFESTYLNKKQYEIIKDIEKHKYRKIIFNGAIGSGKTFLACYFLIKNLLSNRAHYKKGTNNFIVGNSIDSITTNTLKQIEEICDLLKIDFVGKKSNNTFCIIDGLYLKIYGGKNRDAFSKIRGSNSALVYVNEATLMHKDTLTEVLRRLRVAQRTIIFDTNPDNPHHFFKTDYVDNKDTYKTYNFTIYDNPHIDKDFIKTQENIYKDYPSYKARFLLGEWVASTDAVFGTIETIDYYQFKNPICYIDPAFSVGGDNTAVCVMEQYEGEFYCFVYQERRPMSDLSVLTMLSKIIDTFNIGYVYIEDRDSIKTLGSVSKDIVNLRNKIANNFRIRSVKPKSNKFARIMTLLVPVSTKKVKVLIQSSKSIFNDIYTYTGDGKTADDALDAMAGAYILCSNKYSFKTTHFSLGRIL